MLNLHLTNVDENIPGNSNWVTKHRNLMIGGCPLDQKSIELIKKNDIKIFVNLMEHREFDEKYSKSKKLCYNYHIHNKDITYFHYPIKDKTAFFVKDKRIDFAKLKELTKLISDKIKSKQKIYIHSKHGYGRTGLITGLFLHFHHGLGYEDVLNLMNNGLRNRKYFPKKIPVKIPQTAQQFQTLHRIINNRPDDIFFYDKDFDPNYIYSNFYMRTKNRCLFTDDKKRNWYSSESYYQAHKFSEDSLLFNYIRISDTGGKVYCLGQQKTNSATIGKTFLNKNLKKIRLKDAVKQTKTTKMCTNWDDIKINVMKKALFFKFSQNKDIALQLLRTKGKLYEYSHRDSFWGTYWNKAGDNMLGVLLEQLRSVLKKKSSLQDKAQTS